MEELDTYLEFLYDNLEGYVYCPTLNRDSGHFDSKQWYHWPEQREELKTHILSSHSEREVYICPSVFSKKEAKRGSFKASQVVWAELDGIKDVSFKDLPSPELSVQTSSESNLHAYWRISPPLQESKLLDETNRRITYYLEADLSGWDAVQLLRPPQTTNHKYENPKSVRILSAQQSIFEREDLSVEAFSFVPEVPFSEVKILKSELLNPEQLLEHLPLLKSLKKKITKEIPSVGDRSGFLYKISHELAEIGCTHSQISSLLYYVDERIGKFKGRADQLDRISALASVAVSSVQAEDAISLYSIKDVLNHTDDLNWIYQKWLHDRGVLIVTGAPGVGKTQFCLQMAYAACVGEEFLKSPFTQGRVLFKSLEMDVRELKVFLRKQAPAWKDAEKFSDNIKILDEHGSLLQYEEIIEEWQPKLVIVDSLLEWANGELKDDAEVLNLMRWIRRVRRKYNCAFVIIHHNRKANNTNKKPNRLEDLFGSVIINKDIDTALCLWKEDDDPKIEGLLVKSRYFPRKDFSLVRDENLFFDISEEDPDEQPRPGDTKILLGFK